MVIPTRLHYCQYLLSPPINYTLTHFAAHSESFSHDQINRYLSEDRLTPRMLWEHVKNAVVMDRDGFLIFDDTVIDKRYAKKIALARRKYSGNAGGIINGIAIVSCVYVNPKLDRYWLIDYRIYDKDGDGKSKLDHVRDMLSVWVYSRDVFFSTLLMGAWYASKSLLLYIETLDKTYYVPLKCNRLVDDSDAKKPYQRIDTLQWTDAEQRSGKGVKFHKFPRDHKVKVFRVASSQRTDDVATNDLSQSDVSVVRRVCGARWRIEQLHREAKQLTGLENCQGRLARIVRNHIASAFLVWVYLIRKAYETGKTLYQVKHGLLSQYLCQQLKSTTI